MWFENGVAPVYAFFRFMTNALRTRALDCEPHPPNDPTVLGKKKTLLVTQQPEMTFHKIPHTTYSSRSNDERLDLNPFVMFSSDGNRVVQPHWSFRHVKMMITEDILWSVIGAEFTRCLWCQQAPRTW